MRRLKRVLRISNTESRVVVRLLALMFVTWAGFAIGGNAVEGLLFIRVGPDALPYLFVALGATTAGVMFGMNAVLVRPRPQRLLALCLPVMVTAVLGMRALLALNENWVYPVTWLAMMVLWTGAGVVTWGIAGAVHDTRQAKRLFPLYSSGVILGGALGGAGTAPLARWLSAENLLFVWAAALAAGFLLARSVLRSAGAAGATIRVPNRSSATVRARLAAGLRTVTGSKLLTGMSVSVALFAMLYFSLTLLFARAATARFQDADSLTGFLGTFMGATSGTALLASLFAANRLYARWGMATAVLAMPLIYVGGFAALVASAAFVPLLVFRFVQMVWMGGVWAGAWQALYNVVPPERRDVTRAFVDGVALQAGVICAGIIQILALRFLETRVVAVICLVLAATATATAFHIRRAYAGAVVEALRAGNPDVFLVEEEPFGGIRRDATALSIAATAATDGDPAVRRVALEILAEAAPRDARSAFSRALDDDDPTVRCAGLRGLVRLGPDGISEPALELATGLLQDGDAAVRLAAIEVVTATGRRATTALPKLLTDPDPRVRACASKQLLDSPVGKEAEKVLAAMARSEDAEWRAEALRAWGQTVEGTSHLTSAVTDPDPLVRRAAVLTLAARDGEASVVALVDALGDPDPFIRAEAVEGLVGKGPPAVPALLNAMTTPELEADALRALARLGAVDGSVLDRFVRRKLSLVTRYAGLLGMIREDPDTRMELVAHSLRHGARQHALDALQVASRGWDEDAIEAVGLAIENLDARDQAQRATALEALDALGEPAVVRPLLALWEEQTSASNHRGTVLAELMRDPDPWMRACAAFAGRDHPELNGYLEELAGADPDNLVREAAGAVYGGKEGVETLSSVSLMERIVFSCVGCRCS